MNGFERTSSELKAWLESNSILKALLSADIYIMLAALAVVILNDFISGTAIGIFGNIAYYVFLFGVVLCIANKKLTFIYIGLAGYALCRLIYFIYYTFWYIITFRNFSFYYGSLIDFAVFGLIGLFVFLNSGDLKKLTGASKKAAAPQNTSVSGNTAVQEGPAPSQETSSGDTTLPG